MIECVKICCISSRAEAELAMMAGAKALGLVGNMPSGPGVISDTLIAGIAETLPPFIASFLLTSETNAASIAEHHFRTGTNTIQLVDAVPIETYAALRKLIPAVKLVQVVHVLDERDVEVAVELSQHVDFILLDSGNPNLLIKELGGTGRVHDWKLSRKIRDAIKIPLFLAGGLNAGNVRAAIETVQPFGVDICSGVRTEGQLDAKKLDQFFRAIYS